MIELKDEIELAPEPMIATLSMMDALSMTITFPNKKVIKLRRGKSYETQIKSEIDFLSKQRGIAVRKFDDKEFRRWFTKAPSKRPFTQSASLTKEDVEEFNWTDKKEFAIVEKLKERGYIVYPKKKIDRS